MEKLGYHREIIIGKPWRPREIWKFPFSCMQGPRNEKKKFFSKQQSSSSNRVPGATRSRLFLVAQSILITLYYVPESGGAALAGFCANLAPHRLCLLSAIRVGDMSRANIAFKTACKNKSYKNINMKSWLSCNLVPSRAARYLLKIIQIKNVKWFFRKVYVNWKNIFLFNKLHIKHKHGVTIIPQSRAQPICMISLKKLFKLKMLYYISEASIH